MPQTQPPKPQPARRGAKKPTGTAKAGGTRQTPLRAVNRVLRDTTQTYRIDLIHDQPVYVPCCQRYVYASWYAVTERPHTHRHPAWGIGRSLRYVVLQCPCGAQMLVGDTDP